MQCYALLDLLTCILRNKIGQILKIFKQMHIFLSFNLIQRLCNYVHFWWRYFHLCQAISLQQFCPSQSWRVKSCDSVDKSAQPPLESTKSCDWTYIRLSRLPSHPPNISSNHEISHSFPDKAHPFYAGFWSFCSPNLIFYWPPH